MIVSFAPLSSEAKAFLTEKTHVEYRNIDMRNWLCVEVRNADYEIAAVLACERRMPTEWHFNVAVADQRCLTPRIMRTIFVIMFRRLGAHRITALIDPGNNRAIKAAIRMGFVYEGFVRRGVEGRDALMFGMLPEDCRYFQPRRKFRELKEAAHGFATQSA